MSAPQKFPHAQPRASNGSYQPYSNGAPPPKPLKSQQSRLPQQNNRKSQELTTVTSGNTNVDLQVEQALLDLNDLKTEAMRCTASREGRAMGTTAGSGFMGTPHQKTGQNWN